MSKKKKYEEYIYYLSTLLKQEDFYFDYADLIVQGKNSFQVSQRFQKQIFDESWIDMLEDCIIALDTIVRNPRKFIVVEEDIVDISLARSISVESVKHLAQHTNYISSVKNGMVLPSKILNTSKEESYEIYENRFLYTLLLKTKDFIGRRYNLIKQANTKSDQIVVDISSSFELAENSTMSYTMNTVANMPVEEILGAEDDRSLVLRVERINSIVNSFLSSPFAKEMVSCALVRPPITRTNVILKDPNFKKALVLWQFIETYNKIGFEVETVTETKDLSPSVAEKFRNMIYLNTLLVESLAEAKKDGEVLEEQKTDEQKTLNNEYLTKNIDDFVPDDFPQLKMDLHEIRRLFTTVPGEREVDSTEIKKMNAALDRVIRQYKINKQKEDSAQLKRLLQQQLKEEEKLKLEALKQAQLDQKEAEKRKQLEEKARLKAEKQAEKEKKQAEKEERDRLKKEAQEMHDRIVRQEERLMRLRLSTEAAEMERRLNEEKERLAAVERSERERMETEKQLLLEQLEREKTMTYLAPLEGEALLLLRKKEIRKIEEMRKAQQDTMQQLISTHYMDMEAQQRQAIIDMEELAELINFDNIVTTEKEKEEAMAAEDIDVRTFGKKEINDKLVKKLTKEELNAEIENSQELVPEPGEYGYVDFADNAEAVEFDIIPEVEVPDMPEEEPEQVPEETATVEKVAGTIGMTEEDWAFMDNMPDVKEPVVKEQLVASKKVTEDIAVKVQIEPKTVKQKLSKAELKIAKAKAKEEEVARKKALEEERKKVTASFVPTAKEREQVAEAVQKPAAVLPPNEKEVSTVEKIATEQRPEASVEKASIGTSANISSAEQSASGGAQRPRTFIPRSYTPMSVTPENVKEILGEPEGKKKKKKDR